MGNLKDTILTLLTELI